MDLHTLTSLYFVGAGGIGMSALIRYFLANGKQVGGYDKTPSDLTAALIREGAVSFASAYLSGLYPSDSGEPYGIDLFPHAWFSGGEACAIVRRNNPLQPGALCGRYPWEDHDLLVAGPYLEAIACGL